MRDRSGVFGKVSPEREAELEAEYRLQAELRGPREEEAEVVDESASSAVALKVQRIWRSNQGWGGISPDPCLSLTMG